MTTIESFAADMEEYQAQKKGKTFRHIYDQGALNNLKQVCGESYISWLVSSSPQSDGLNWETFKNLDVWILFFIRVMTYKEKKLFHFIFRHDSLKKFWL